MVSGGAHYDGGELDASENVRGESCKLAKIRVLLAL